MTLKKFMGTWKVSERDIIEAGKLTSSICGSFDCENCPFDSNYGCLIVLVPADVNIGEEVKKRIQELLHPNHMDKVAEILGVKLGEPFKIAYDNKNIISGFHLEKTGLYCDKNLRAPFNLTELLAGDAYIVKEENKNEQIRRLCTANAPYA